MLLFTVFTPTFNRANTIHRVYESLQKQTCRDFEWLIVDDGSQDDTSALVANWQQTADFPIRYFWQPNGHKKTAFNQGVGLAAGQFFLTADSDDAFPPTALERLAHYWEIIPEDQKQFFVGVSGLCKDQHGREIGDKFPGTWGIDSNSQELRYKHRVLGEKWGFSRTDILREYPFPESIPGHVPEAVVWMAIAAKYKTRFVNEVFRIYYQGEQDQLTNNGNIKSNANGAFYQKYITLNNEMQYFRENPKHFLLESARWTRFFLHLGNNRTIGINYFPKNYLGRALIIFSTPVGALWWLLDKINSR